MPETHPDKPRRCQRDEVGFSALSPSRSLVYRVSQSSSTVYSCTVYSPAPPFPIFSLWGKHLIQRNPKQASSRLCSGWSSPSAGTEVTGPVPHLPDQGPDSRLTRQCTLSLWAETGQCIRSPRPVPLLGLRPHPSAPRPHSVHRPLFSVPTQAKRNKETLISAFALLFSLLNKL